MRTYERRVRPPPPELTTDDLLVLDDPRFGPETVAIVTGAASGIGRAYHCSTKVDRSPEFLGELMQLGSERAAAFLDGRRRH